MILSLHLLVGAVIAVKFEFLPLVILFAFLSHYLLDFIPHWEYSIENIKKRNWKKSGLDFLKLTLDLGVGSILIMFIHHLTRVNYFILFTAAFFAILPDILTALNWLCPNNKVLKYHFNFHHKIHFPKDPAPEQVRYGAGKKILLFWRIFSQVLIVIIVIALL